MPADPFDFDGGRSSTAGPRQSTAEKAAVETSKWLANFFAVFLGVFLAGVLLLLLVRLYIGWELQQAGDRFQRAINKVGK
jgi:hypothetical protein